MSRSALIRLPFGGQIRPFQLAIGQLEELQEACNAGPLVIVARLESSSWRARDVRETLRLGLIGGGMTDLDAMKWVDRYAGPGQLGDAVMTAIAVVKAAVFGSPDGDGEDDTAGEMAGETATATDSPTAS